MAKQEYVDIANVAKGWSAGVYPTLLEASMCSFSNRPLRGPAFIIPVLERSYASALCSLAAFQIEGILQKISLNLDGGEKREQILKHLTKTGQNTAVRELFVVRDVIAHGHIYKTTIRLKSDGFPKSSHSKKLTIYESQDFKNHVSRNKTKLLNFNVDPARISFPDAVLALAVVNVIYKELENRSIDMPIDKFIPGKGYVSKYFSVYINDLLRGLDKKRASAVKRKLKIIASI
ncbi:MAG: hypothetical protein AAB971_00920 [Patescibacteria group bacterium]